MSAQSDGHHLWRPGPGEDGRRAILAAAARVFAARGYLATSIDAIADELGATKGRVYHYYRSKGEIFLDVVVHGMYDLLAAIEPLAVEKGVTAAERLRRMAHRHAELMLIESQPQRVAVQAVENRRVPEVAVHAETLQDIFDLRRRYERCFTHAIEEGIAAGEFTPQDASLASKAALGALNWIPIWFSPDRGAAATPEVVADFFADYIVRAVGGEAQS